MKRPNITAGPWNANLHREMKPQRTKVETRNIVICDTIGHEANAVAIAALPDLLAALERIMAFYDAHGSSEGQMCQEAKAALIKAGYQI